jgi:hypothetical protein
MYYYILAQRECAFTVLLIYKLRQQTGKQVGEDANQIVAATVESPEGFQ